MSDRSNTQPPQQTQWKLIHSLTTNDTITINDTNKNLTVTNTETITQHGNTLQKITLKSNTDDTYTIFAPHKTENTPVMQTEKQTAPITSIEPTGETILTINNTPEYNSPKSQTEDTYLENRTQAPRISAENSTILGDCPQCDCIVVKDNSHAICTNCGQKTPYAQWKMHTEKN